MLVPKRLDSQVVARQVDMHAVVGRDDLGDSQAERHPFERDLSLIHI